MQAFLALFEQLDQLTGTTAKVASLVNHFKTVPEEDAAWALTLLLGKRRRRLITGRRLREILRDHGDLPEWLIADCHGQVGDSAETISLLWPCVKERISPVHVELPAIQAGRPLHWWMEILLPSIATLKEETQAEAVLALWHALPDNEHFMVNKLMTGGFRVGVSTGLISRAIAEAFELEESLVVQRLMGGFEPSAANFRKITAPTCEEEQRSSGKPYPFFLASPLDRKRTDDSNTEEWLIEWKWDGIRGQLIHRGDSVYLWSRGEELINNSFPELIAVGKALPPGTVLDGEVICWEKGQDAPMGFDQLQRRVGRKTVGATLKRECPVRFIAYDLLELEGTDVREQPLHARQQQLRDLMAQLDHQDRWRFDQSHSWTLRSWNDLDEERNRARERKAEGLMLKRADSPYLSGRKRGHWWKHKLEPMTLDAVLIYAQAGSGRRANLFTDYTFGLWNNNSPPELVTFAKAYSGLNDKEILELDRWIRRNTLQRYGPARAVKTELVFEIGFEGIHPSKRHKSGIAVRFPRILRWRHDKLAEQADQLITAQRMIEAVQSTEPT